MTKTVKHARRYCSVENCTKIVKSQGVCQAHGAKTRKCKMVGCTKQAQGNFDGMCKKHFKESREELKVVPVPPPAIPPQPQGSSVYDDVLPASLSYVPNNDNNDSILPLARHLKEGFDANRPRGWHRQDERRARGLLPVPNSTIQLEGWERELVWLEICILSGSADASFRHLARAWGRDKGFHMVLAQFICERRGNVERKQRLKKQKQKRRCKSEYNDGQFMEDILDFEDMELPIDMLHVLEHETEGMVNGNDDDEMIANVAVKNKGTKEYDAPLSMEAQGEEAHLCQESPAAENDYCDPLDEHLLMTTVAAADDSVNNVNSHTDISAAAATKNELVDDNRTHESTTLVPT